MNEQHNYVAKLEKEVPEDMKKLFANLQEFSKLSKFNDLLDSKQSASALDDDNEQNLWGIGLYK